VQFTEPVADFHVPAPQGVHAVPSAPVYPARQVQIELFSAEKVLFGHAIHFLAVEALYVPAVHFVQTLTPIALHVPAEQFVQAIAPAALDVPAVQFMQTLTNFAASAALYVPAVHFVQTTLALAPDIALHVPAVQFVQAAEPVAFFHVPAPQGVHGVPSAPVYPATQVQIELPSAEKVLFGHGEQVFNAVAATAVEEVFAPHDVQATEPVAFFHLPAPQGVQATLPSPVYPARQVQI
jgi:hypothetical protein